MNTKIKNLIYILLFVSTALFSQSGQKYKTMFVAAAATPIGGGATTWTNLVSWWKMTETSGGVAADSHGSDDGVVVGASQTSSGLVFDGTGDSVVMSPDAYGTDDFTIIMRINPTYSAGVGESVITGPGNNFQLGIYEGHLVSVARQDDAMSSWTGPGSDLTAGSVNMLAIVRDGTNFRIFLNGEGFQNLTLSSSDFTSGWESVGNETGNTHADFNGTIRDLCYFSDAKSNAYITAFYNSGDFTDYEDGDPDVNSWTNLISWWEMKEASGGIVTDSHGTDDGTVTNAVQSTSGITFDGTGDYVTITGSVVSDATFAFWCKPTASTGDIFGGAENSMKCRLWVDYKPRIMIAGGGGSSVVSLALTYDTWSFVTIVVDGTANTVRFGVDGSYETETDWTANPSVATTTIGASAYDGSEFIGMIKQFAWFSDKKTDSYLTALYNSGADYSYSAGDPE